MNKMEILNVNNLSFSYGNKKVLEDVNFTLSDGEFLTILGENGSGKTTLLNLILGFKKPDRGEIILDKELGSHIGYLPQQNNIKMHFPATVWEIVLSGCVNRLKGPFFREGLKKRAEINIEALGIEELKERAFSELSGGQQQKVLIARALSASDRLLILDEPVSGLDPDATNELYTLIKHINKDMGTSVIMVSHDEKGSINCSDKLLKLRYENNNGSVDFFGLPEDFKRGYRSV